MCWQHVYEAIYSFPKQWFRILSDRSNQINEASPLKRLLRRVRQKVPLGSNVFNNWTSTQICFDGCWPRALSSCCISFVTWTYSNNLIKRCKRIFPLADLQNQRKTNRHDKFQFDSCQSKNLINNESRFRRGKKPPLYILKQGFIKLSWSHNSPYSKSYLIKINLAF